ncbi:MAG: hypothetical protein F4W95_13020 [Chloroflexi bacterium]|nr:hypothetical protein [Chloroflexota bacterium]MYD49391.1 hypothetical protein [Chloroflexota bacterium]
MGQPSRLPPPPPPVGRRIFHLLAASGTTLMSLVIPEHPYILLIGGGALLALGMEASRFRVGVFNRLFMLVFAPILKQSEVSEVSGATWFLIAAFFTFYFYGPEVALPVLLFVAVGDPAAALVGTHLPGPRFWGKSPSGGVAFVVAALAIWAVLCALGFGEWSSAVIIAAVIASLVELSPLPVDDNLTVPLIAGAVMTLAISLGL